MKAHTWIAWTAAVVALPLVSCSSTDTKEPRDVQVTLKGEHADNIRSAMLALSDVTVTVDGKPVDADIAPQAMDLAGDGDQVVATFQHPGGGPAVVKLCFDDYGGYETDDGDAGIIDAGGKPLTVTLPVRAIENGKAEIALDMAGSLVASPGAWMLVPHYSARY